MVTYIEYTVVKSSGGIIYGTNDREFYVYAGYQCEGFFADNNIRKK